MATRRKGGGDAGTATDGRTRKRRSDAESPPTEPDVDGIAAPPAADAVAAALELAERCAPCQRDLKALAAALPADLPALDAALASASAERREGAFGNLLFARLHLGHALPAELLVDGGGLLPTVDALAAAAGKLTGDVGSAILLAMQRGQFGWERDPVALLVVALWSKRAGAELPPTFVAEARIRARREATHEGEDALVALRGLVDDPDLGSLIEPLVAPDVKEAARALTARLVDHLLGPPLSVFPERVQRETVTGAPVRRAAAKVGRNDPCPCGSGKKYKQCHESADRARLAESSDVEGLTSTELARDLERHLTDERLKAMRGPALARLDPTKIAPELRIAWVELLGAWGEHAAAVRAIEAWWPAEGPLDEVLDDLARRVIERAAIGDRLDLARALEARRVAAGVPQAPLVELLLEARLKLCEPSERLDILEVAARNELDVGGVELGFGLIGAGLRGLGIHVARSQLALRRRDAEADALYATMVEARDLIGAPPWDPIDDALYTIEHGVTPDVDRELAVARRKVDASEASLRATVDALANVREELERREAQAVAEAAKAHDPREAPVVSVEATAEARDDRQLRELRERVERLKSELKDRHRERNALRRELDDTREQVAELQREREDENDHDGDEDPEDDAEDAELDASVAARIRMPSFPDGFAEQLRVVPEATARAVLVRIGELCAGFDTAFREVRPLRGFDGVWRAKIGRSYRLLFRPLDHVLDIVDLVHRQDLEKRLFRLRRGGEG